jgi:NAD(P)-dependent dehydrogenase (short-subunit alcohol dehydrogenase family)
MKEQSVLLITGGSRGIGAVVARLAAEEGYSIVINYRSEEQAAEEVVSTIVDMGGKAVSVQGDVSIEKDVQRVFKEANRLMGPVSHLVNNAGIDGSNRIVADFDSNHLTKLFAVNVIGTMLCCREATLQMSTRLGGKGGVIVNISSMAATIGGRAGASDYAASKAAVDTFTVGFAKEVASEGIRVNTVRPGMTLTDMTANVLDDPQLLSDIADTIPMQRVAQAHEIAQPILWLLSNQATFVSGACLDASGGGFIVGKQI